MGSTNKELLDLEHRGSSAIESRLLICKNGHSSRQGNLHPNKSDGEKHLTTPVPTSQVFGRVKNFWGAMEEANKKLMREAKDLRLGLVDLYTPEAVAAAESAVASPQMAIPETVRFSDADYTDDDEIVGHPALSGSSSSEDECERSDKRKRPKITEL